MSEQDLAALLEAAAYDGGNGEAVIGLEDALTIARGVRVGDDGLDMPRLRQAVTNIARRHGITQDPTPPASYLRIYGYSRATPDMDAEVAAEYAALAESSDA